MSTFGLLIVAALTGQAGDSRYPGGTGGFVFGREQQSPASANNTGSASAAGQPAAGNAIAPPPAALQGPPSRVDSAYSVAGPGTPAASGFAPVNNSPGQSHLPGAIQPPPNVNTPFGGNGRFSPIGSDSTSLSRDAIARTPASPSSPPSDGALKPSGMMRAMMAPPANSRLPGQWVKLEEVVSAGSSRDDQSKQIEAYWDLCSSIADYFLGLREQGEIQKLRQRFPGASGALQQAEQQLAVRVGTAERAARASQFRLASLVGRGADRLPLPADLPLCSSYETRHDQVFAGRSSTEADELNQLIALRHAELDDACAAVNRTDAWLSSISNSPSGVSDESNLLRALELLALERRAFVQIARDYNRRIARYVELARPGQVGSDQLIGMLIKRSRPATAIAPTDRRSQTNADGSQTFAGGADGWMSVDPPAEISTALRDESISPASAEARPFDSSERSLLVPPR